MASRPQLPGNVDNRDQIIDELQSDVRDLTSQLQEARMAAQRARQEAANAVAGVRGQLRPLHAALCSLFGELDKVPGVGEVSGPDASPRSAGVWESWIQRLGGKQAEFIRALLEHGHAMTAEQLRVATHTGKSTVPQVIHKLTKLGLLSKKEGKYCLKDL